MTAARGQPEIHLIPSDSGDGTPRRLEPFTVGVPFPRGMVRDPSQLVAVHSNASRLPLQAAVLDRWPDGSMRWALLDLQADVARGTSARLEIGGPVVQGKAAPLAHAIEHGIEIRTGALDVVLSRKAFPFDSISIGGQSVLDAGASGCFVVARDGRVVRPRVTLVELEDNGPVRASVRIEAAFDIDRGADIRLIARLHFLAGKSAIRFDLTLRNPRRARHQSGFWELGDSGSLSIRGASIAFAIASDGGPAIVRCSERPGSPLSTYRIPFELYQDSSGGDNWQSSSHVDARGVVPTSFRGYALTAADVDSRNLRATPVVQLMAGRRPLSIAVERFWENFPKSIQATERALTLDLWPERYAAAHELQGGEQKTHTFWVAFGDDDVSAVPFDWCRSPSRAIPAPSWCCAAGVVPFLTPRDEDPHPAYLELVDSAIRGADTFERKREAVDEYGWRHFGDVWADHEAVFHRGSTPLVSHYNNQYDAIAGFAYQYLRSGEPRWHGLMDDLAWHVSDVDIYHTVADWAKYNHGLFWHTVHYQDAGRSTHRSYPRAGKVNGGGPSAGHLYTTGLMHHYFLTGARQSREAVLELAAFVIDCDDGAKSIFRWLGHHRTGLASASGTLDYHGPGRAAANSINALVDAHRLTGETRYLAKAEELVRRCIHPLDDIDSRELLSNVEYRWFYTMFLQSLGRFLLYKHDLGELDDTYAYAQASLLRYARWMADRERPYLERPEVLEYPTETWAAQDLRKSEVFQLASLHVEGAERERFLERAAFFFDYAIRTLSSMPTRTLARPVILLLSHGWSHAVFNGRVPLALPRGSEQDFGLPVSFVPQKLLAIRRAKLLFPWSVVLFVASIAAIVYSLRHC
jgi:hypothetical protein